MIGWSPVLVLAVPVLAWLLRELLAVLDEITRDW